MESIVLLHKCIFSTTEVHGHINIISNFETEKLAHEGILEVYREPKSCY